MIDHDTSREKLGGACRVSEDSHIRLRVHPGTEADPPLVLVSPYVSVARGVAVTSLVTRAVTRT